MMNIEYRISNVECRSSRVRARLLAPRASHLAPRLGITLIEVLMSMFVLLFGLMGVAALFPVGNFYIQSGEKYELGSSLAQSAFEDLQARKLLRPDVWVYAGDSAETEAEPLSSGSHNYPPQNPLVIQNSLGPMPGAFNVPFPTGPGHAFVIDPLSSANAISTTFLDEWPLAFNTSGTPVRRINPWTNANNTNYPANAPQLSGAWPIRRVTLTTPDPTNTFTFTSMTKPIAETIFRLRDDLTVEQPKQNDRPAIQRWDTADPSNTPNDLTDDALLARQYQGNYSWLATVVPISTAGLTSMQPASNGYGSLPYEVSVVVFRKRDETPSSVSERLVDAEMLLGGELVIYANTAELVDQAIDGIRSGQWICVAGVHQSSGVFLMKWYRLLSIDSLDVPAEQNTQPGYASTNSYVRRATLAGPEWPGSGIGNSVTNLKAVLLPGAISAVTRSIPLE